MHEIPAAREPLRSSHGRAGTQPCTPEPRAASRSILSHWIAAAALLLTAVEAAAQLAVPPPEPIRGARMPALSPDGQRLAFVYQGDIWTTAATGGRAGRLSLHVEMDAFPVFSPDGAWVAFGSKRNGNWDIFVVPADGGKVRQLTFHGADEIPCGWTPDGSSLLFSAKLDLPNHGLFRLNVNTLQLSKLAEDYSSINFPNCSPDGQWVVYGRNGFHWTRPRYSGSAAAQTWLIDLRNGTRRAITDDNRQHLWARFMPDGQSLLVVTTGESTPSSTILGESSPPLEDNAERTPNLWTLETRTGRARRMTGFVGGSVRFPTVSETGDIAFEYEQDLWLLRAGQTPQTIAIYAAEDEKQTTKRREKLTAGVTEAEPAPDGKTFAFGLRGDIWTVATDKPKGAAGRNAEFARRLTEWEGDDSDFVWSQDGKRLFFTSDRLLNTRLYALEVESGRSRCLWDRPEDVARPMLSPDGKCLSFWVAGSEGGLYVLELDSERARRVARAPGTHWYGFGGGDVEWAPDSRWLAYNCRGENQACNIWIVSAAGGEPVNVTSLNAMHGALAWSPDGKYLFFQSNRDGEGLYALPLVQEQARVADADPRFEKSKGVAAVQIDFAGITRRIRKLSSQTPQADLTVSPDGAILFLADGDIWSVSYDGKESKRLTTDGGKSSLRISADGQTFFYMRNGELWTMRTSERGPAERISFVADWEQNVRAERVASFAQFWRSYHRGFYDSNFHGRDWSAIRRRYEPLLGSVETREEFATLLQMMVGELDASHSEVTPAPGGPTAPITPHLGFTFDYAYAGPGLRVATVPPGAPGSYPQTSIRAGDYVLAINGRDVRADENLFRWINDKQDREFEFLVNGEPSREGARVVRYRVLTQDDWRDLLYRNRVDATRKYVELHSHGQVGYLHLPGMGSNNQAQFEREAYEYVLGKQAMILDVRFNTGGYVADTLIDWLDRKPRGFVRPRDGNVRPSPARAWDKPLVVLVNEHSFSNAEIFAYAMRARGLAQLVGTPTPGYVIWTDQLSLVDGTGARMPMSAAYRLDGTPQENHGEKPDVEAPLPPDEWLSGRDRQLDQALALLSTPTRSSPAGEQPSVAASASQ